MCNVVRTYYEATGMKAGINAAARRGWTALAGGGAVLAGVTLAFSFAPAALAAPGLIVDMGDQCRAQYPGNADFLPAEAYLVAPRDANSWRCKRVSTSPKGGIVTDLAVDPNAYCARHGVGHAIPGATPPNWLCVR